MKNNIKYRLAILIAAACFGLIPIFGQALTNHSVSSFKQTFFMELFALILLTPLYFLLLKPKLIRKKDILFFVFFGLSLFLVNLMPLTAIALSMPVALVSLLLYIYPAVTLILSRIWFGDKISIRKIIYVIFSLIGVLLILVEGVSDGKITLLGTIIALLGGVSLAFWACFGRASSEKNYTPFDSLYWSEVFAVILLIVSAFIFPVIFSKVEIGHFDFHFTTKSLELLVAMAFICVFVGHSLFFYGVGKIKTLQASIIALFEPITAVTLSAVIYKQELSILMLIGGIFIFAASILVSMEDK